MTNENQFIVDGQGASLRLDRFLCEAATLSLRSARRLIERGAVLVDGAARQASYKLREGQGVLIESPRDGAPEPPNPQGASLLKAEGGFAAFFKPPGLHTVELSGGGEPSLEAMLGHLYPDGPVRLVNRLDQDTSGIVLGALDETSSRRFRSLENLGAVDKRYLAVVAGNLMQPVLLTWALDMADRATVKVLDEDARDELRFTSVRPLAHRILTSGAATPFAPGDASPDTSGDAPANEHEAASPAGAGPCGESDLTLVEARIAKGARHQIRAHLARAGFPILGDSRYGGPAWPGLRLHHWSSTFAGFEVRALPQWPEWTAWNTVHVSLELSLEEN
ncbi:MAG: 23S rRNA pseudouridine [Desulfovibrionaceae bacterium]|nr:MAG: 23S rRNA pseudouridine [Desulfovibrionaceae bacterium]